MTQHRVLILLTARGGSKGLPGKNLALVGGIPLVGRAARVGGQAVSAFGTGSRVVCSTDDEGIADAARGWGGGGGGKGRGGGRRARPPPGRTGPVSGRRLRFPASTIRSSRPGRARS